MQRKEAMQYIADLGGFNQDGINKETNILILGNNDYNPILKGEKSNKLKKAEELKQKGNDIEIISENVFYELINYIEKQEDTDDDSINGIKIENGNFNEDEIYLYNEVKKILINNGRSIKDVRCNLNSSNYFDVLLFYPILRAKVRGKQKYFVIDKYVEDKYDFSHFAKEEATKNDNGKYRLVIEDLCDVKLLENYICDLYDSAKKGNDDYIRSVTCGQSNYDNYLKITYE